MTIGTPYEVSIHFANNAQPNTLNSMRFTTLDAAKAWMESHRDLMQTAAHVELLYANGSVRTLRRLPVEDSNVFIPRIVKWVHDRNERHLGK